MTAPNPNGTAPSPEPPQPTPASRAQRRQLVRLDCAECGKLAAVVLPEDASTFALCPDCAPGGAARRHASTTAERGNTEDDEEAFSDASEEWAAALQQRGASQDEIQRVWNAAEALYRAKR